MRRISLAAGEAGCDRAIPVIMQATKKTTTVAGKKMRLIPHTKLKNFLYI